MGLPLCVILYFALSAFQILVLCTSYFNCNMSWRGSILVISVWCPGGFLYWNGHVSWNLGNFILLFCWVCYVYLWLVPFLLPQCPWFSGLIFCCSCSILVCSFHSSWVVWLRFLLFFIYIYFVFEPWNSFTCSSLNSFIDLRDFFSQDFYLIFFFRLSISLLYSTFISCIVSYFMYFFILYSL
jgi:hypothetical protein